MKLTGIAVIFFTLILFSCRKDSFITSPDARVRITADTLKYDTVFVTAGSVYQTFKVVNENDEKLNLSSIKLMGGSNSVYKINVDGIPGVQFNNIVLEPGDSVYVFAQVNVDPGTGNLPFILRDSIEILFNGNKRLVQLEAWGQNAHFFRDKIISTNETWNNDLPYVILGSLTVNPNQSLTINKGCRIYIHADAPLIINGTLLVNGLKDSADRVYFQGDRLDEPYREFPAAWPGIFFQTSSKDNRMNYAVLRNAFQAVVVLDPSNTSLPKLTLNECIIDNAFDAGIAAVNSKITARNCLIRNCGKNIILLKGGDYQFTHCTAVTIGNRYIDHKEPVLTMANHLAANVVAPLTAVFRNCIFWGENGLVDDEVKVSKAPTTFAFNILFDANLWKTQTNPLSTPGVSGSGIINNQHPLFDSVNTFMNHYSFRLQNNSPAINKGVNAGIFNDLDGNSRPVGPLPDLGAYEKQ